MMLNCNLVVTDEEIFFERWSMVCHTTMPPLYFFLFGGLYWLFAFVLVSITIPNIKHISMVYTFKVKVSHIYGGGRCF
jgi:hypothetical protein